jgi:uncharacterized alkaline shock family protein YloU
MESTELKFPGIGISSEVACSIVATAAEKVEGVASVGQRATASNLVSVFFTNGANVADEPSVEVEVVDDALAVTLHLTVFYGYPFTKLADAVRAAVARAVVEHMGVDIASIDICIDSIVFPKE